jgi:hypothetical protein
MSDHIKWLLTAFFALFMVPVQAGSGHDEAGHSKEAYTLPHVDPAELNEQLQHTANLEEFFEVSSELAKYHIKYTGDYPLADSLLQVSIDQAALTYDNRLLMLSYANYLLALDEYIFLDKVKNYTTRLQELETEVQDPKALWLGKLAMAKGFLLQYETEQAMDYAYQALNSATALKDDEKMALSHLMLGEVLRELSNHVEAIRNLLSALTIADAKGDMALRMKCYNGISKFYNLINAYNKSIDYKLKELQIAEGAANPDSILIMTLKFDLEVIAFNNRTLNEAQLYHIIDFADRNDVVKLKRVALIAFRNHLIKQNDLEELHHLYHKQYPEELKAIQQKDTTTYYRLQAFFCEYEKKPDSAMYYYNLAEERMLQVGDQMRLSSFYLRFGDFLNRGGQVEAAIDKYNRSYALAGEISYFEFQIEATGKLEKLYSSLGQYQQAYNFSNLNRSLTDSLNTLMQKEKLTLLELENEEVIRAQQLEKAAEQIQRRNNIQYTAITILIITLFIVLLILGGIQVSPGIIRMLGFLSFIFFFEFIILLIDTWLHHQTHGEPWKILAFKIVLMCGLVPLHHTIEKRVTHYLIEKKMVLSKPKLFGKKTDAPTSDTHH